MGETSTRPVCLFVYSEKVNSILQKQWQSELHEKTSCCQLLTDHRMTMISRSEHGPCWFRPDPDTTEFDPCLDLVLGCLTMTAGQKNGGRTRIETKFCHQITTRGNCWLQFNFEGSSTKGDFVFPCTAKSGCFRFRKTSICSWWQQITWPSVISQTKRKLHPKWTLRIWRMRLG